MPRFLLLLICLPLHLLLAQRPQPLSPAINSAYEEREPTPSPDGRWLYFWRRSFPENRGGPFDPGDIWVAPRLGDAWGTPLHPRAPLNGKGHDFVWQVSPDGDTLWMMHTLPGVNDDGLSYSVRDARGRWSSPRRLRIADFRYRGTVKDFFLGPGRLLFLTHTDTLRGYGGSDLYLAVPLNDTAWSRPVNLGEVINTPGDEDAPFLAPDGRTLYFNSNGRGGYGDHDIYAAYRLDYTYRRWSEPVNLGPSVNGPGYDFDFFTSADGNTAYWASEVGSPANTDLFRLDINTCQVDIYPGQDTTLCQGQALRLSSGYVRGRDLSYQWLRDGVPIDGAQEATLSTQRSGAYQLVRSRYGCRDTSAATQVRFVLPPEAAIQAPASVLCAEGQMPLRAQPDDATSYQWQFNGRDLPEANGSTYPASVPGTYTLRVAYGGCATTSAPLTLTRLDEPEVRADSDPEGEVPILPQWLWNNRLTSPRGETHVEALAINQQAQVFVLTSHLRGRQVEDEITVFRKQGLTQTSFGVGRRETDAPRLLATLPNGDLVMADPERYLTCYTPSGRMRWTKGQSMPGLVGLAVDELGYLYAAAWLEEDLLLDGQEVLLPKRGGMMLAKYAPDGDLAWVRAFPIDGEVRDISPALQVDAAGHVYLAGSLELIANFGPPQVVRATPGKRNYFLASFDPNGETRWATKFGADRGRDGVRAFYTDRHGISFVGIGQSFWRVNAEGRPVWAGALQGTGGESLQALAIGAARKDGYIYGLTEGGRYFLTKHNRLDRQTVIWEGKFSGKDERHPLALAADQAGHVYLSGLSEGNLPGTAFDLTSDRAAFLLKYGPPANQFERKPVELCDRGRAELLTLDEPGLRYQWFRDGAPLAGATQARLWVSEPGTYQVRIITPDCNRLSPPRQVTDCGQDPGARPPQLVDESQPPPREATPPSDDPYSFDGYASNNLVLLLDVSASMNEPNKLPVLKDAFLQLITHMRAEDQVSIVTYAGGVKVLLSGVPATDQQRINRAIERLSGSGGTKGKRGLKKAYKLADRHFIAGGNNRIIMATDGYFDVDKLYRLADRIADDNINLSVFSFGKLFDRQVVELERLADEGRGNYENITRTNVAEALLREAKAVRRE